MKLRSLVVMLSLALLTVSCGGDSEPETDATGSTEDTGNVEAGEPVRGGTLVAAIDSDPGQLNPAITTSGGVHAASELMYNGLVELSPSLEPLPELAESWEIEDDGATYRFTLRDGVTWHDGEPFTSADVKYSFEEVLLQLHSRTKASVGAALESIETPDDQTVVFRFSQPYAPLLQQLNVTEAPIVPEHIYAGTDPQENPANQAPVGTGPFQFVSYQPGQEIVLEANDDYFKPERPYLDGVVLRIIPEEANQVIALEEGEVDWIFGVPGPDLPRLEESGDIDFLQTSVNPGGANCIMTVSFNLERPIFQSPEVREAIAYALDRSQFLERVEFGQGAVAEAPIHSGIPFAHAEGLDIPDADPGRAASILEEAGWLREGDGTRVAQGVEGVADGTPLSFNFLSFPTFAQYGELFRSQLAEVGIDVSLETLEPAVFADTVFVKRAFDTNVISYCNGTDPAIGVRRMYISSNIGPIPFSNSSAYRNEEIDQLFDEAIATVDPEDRSPIYQEISEILVKDLPYLWLVETVSTRAYQADCQGFQESGHFAETAFCDR
ncbi:MAG TPA: ABC transporter substrate-binding protein [Acidimicrobiales bacterium]|nr:ABC transporter substrate-binding protein [Acidimicrobiales bacterium]